MIQIREYTTKYYYVEDSLKRNESGNRIRKIVIYDKGITFPETITDEFYVRDISGREIAIYNNLSNSLEYWNIWAGSELIGRINPNSENDRYYYLKDHLGTIRTVLDNGKNIIFAQDGVYPDVFFIGNMWGYPLENRTLGTDDIKNKFTGKERDKETTYDYFGARYYDARISNWTNPDPLFEKHLQWTPYNYSIRSPIIFTDFEGKDPIRNNFVNGSTLKSTLNNLIGTTFSNLYQTFSETYIFTRYGGIIDLKHFFAAAYYSYKFSSEISLLLGEIKEITQKISELFGDNNTSGFNPEDPPSNYLGSLFGSNLKNNSGIIDKEFVDRIMENFESLNIIDPEDSSISDEFIYIPSVGKMKKLPNRCITSPNFYSPYYGENKYYYEN